MKLKKFMNKKGFSLIELMVVVAIIGLLAAVGIPQYGKFQAKARTSEAKAALSALFNTEKSFQLEWQTYTVDLNNVGFAVEGQQLRYVTGFTTATACGGTYPASAPAETTTRTQSISAGVATSGAVTWNPTIGVLGTPSAALTGSVCNQTAFTAKAVGDPRNTPATLAAGTSDTWTIDQVKAVRNPIINY